MLLMVCFNISAQKAIVRRTNKVSHTQKTTRTNKSRINHSKTTPARKNKSIIRKTKRFAIPKRVV